MKKVLHVITRLDTGGSAENILLSARLADKKRYCVIIAAGSGNYTATTPDGFGKLTTGKSGNYYTTTAPDKSGNYSLGAVHIIPHLVREIHPLQDVLAFFEIVHLIKKIKPDIVHTHSSKAGFLGRWAAWICRVPVIVYTPHGHVFYGYFGLVKTKMFVWLERLTAKITRRLIALTNGELQESLAYGIGKPEQWVVIHSGVGVPALYPHPNPLLKHESASPPVPEGEGNTENCPFPKGEGIHFDSLSLGERVGVRGKRVEIRKLLGIPENVLVVGTVARLEPVKGVRFFVEAAAQIVSCVNNNPYFIIVGDGKLRSELERTAQTLGVKDKVTFTGERTDILELLEAMDIYVQPSLNEGMGKVLVMAQVAGLPVVASRVSGIPDVVKDGQTGLLVPPGDPESLSGALKKLLGDESLRYRLGKEGQVWVNEKVDGYTRFSVERMVYLLEKLYEEVV